MALPAIGKFSLDDQGGFDVKLQFTSIDDNGNKIHHDGTGAYPLGQTETLDPGAYGASDGDLISIYAFVVWGTDNQGNQLFTYQQGSSVTAYYTISGTTLNNQLGLNNVG